MVPRAALQYRRLEFGALPARQRAAAARIALLRDTVPGALSRVAWVGPVAHVWSWLPPEDASARERAAWVPESLVRPRAFTDGPRLIALVDGVEGQVWRGGDLVASQWWPSPPSPDAWHRFLRSAAIAPDANARVPAAFDAGWSAPWARLRGAAAGPDLLEAAAWRAALAGLALVLGWQLTAQSGERDAHAALVARTEALRLQAMPLLDAREHADAARADIDRLRALQRASSDYALMPAVTLPLGKGARLLGWLRQGDVLKAKVSVADTDPRHAVDAFARIGLLADVEATPESGAVGLEFELPEVFSAPGMERAQESGGAGTE